jgi:hypothetical protein
VLAIVAGILVARHLKTVEDLNDCHASPRTEYLVAAAVQRAERIMRKIDNVFGNESASGESASAILALIGQSEDVHLDCKEWPCVRKMVREIGTHRANPRPTSP